MSKFKNSELHMSKETFKEVLEHYIKKPTFIGMNASDLEYFFYLVHDLLKKERDALMESESYAKYSIDRLESARHEVFMLSLDVGEAFEEVFG